MRPTANPTTPVSAHLAARPPVPSTAMATSGSRRNAAGSRNSPVHKGWPLSAPEASCGGVCGVGGKVVECGAGPKRGKGPRSHVASIAAIMWTCGISPWHLDLMLCVGASATASGLGRVANNCSAVCWTTGYPAIASAVCVCAAVVCMQSQPTCLTLMSFHSTPSPDFIACPCHIAFSCSA